MKIWILEKLEYIQIAPTLIEMKKKTFNCVNIGVAPAVIISLDGTTYSG
jgi:hypothetical protein